MHPFWLKTLNKYILKEIELHYCKIPWNKSICLKCCSHWHSTLFPSWFYGQQNSVGCYATLPRQKKIKNKTETWWIPWKSMRSIQTQIRHIHQESFENGKGDASVTRARHGFLCEGLGIKDWHTCSPHLKKYVTIYLNNLTCSCRFHLAWNKLFKSIVITCEGTYIILDWRGKSRVIKQQWC